MVVAWANWWNNYSKACIKYLGIFLLSQCHFPPPQLKALWTNDRDDIIPQANKHYWSCTLTSSVTDVVLRPTVTFVYFLTAENWCEKHCWDYFAFTQSYLAEGKIALAVLLLHEAKEKWMILHWRIRNGSDWWFSKILRIRSGSDSISSDQDWTRTEKIHSTLISAAYGLYWQGSKKHRQVQCLKQLPSYNKRVFTSK